MKRIGALLLGALCALLLAFAALAEETPLAQALAGSEWSAYAPVVEETEGALCAGVARDAQGKRIFVIAEKGEDGAFSLAACYERLISENADLEKLSVTPRPEGDSNKNCAYVRLSLKKTNMATTMLPSSSSAGRRAGAFRGWTLRTVRRKTICV